jgi:hypothetical protein
MAQAAHFFVSYTGADRPGRTGSLGKLEAEGYQVVVKAWYFTAGNDWTPEVQHATATAERIMAVLSAWYLRSAQGRPSGGALRPGSSGARVAAAGPRGQVDSPGLIIIYAETGRWCSGCYGQVSW